MGISRKAVVVAVVLALCVLAAGPALQGKGQNVTFKNEGTRAVHILACYGGEGACDQKTEKKQLVVEPGKSIVLESGADNVCFCTSKFSAVSTCAEGTWLPANPGSYKRVGK